MKIRILVMLQCALIVVLAALLAGRYVSFRDPRPLTREPAAPGEATTLAYTPPPPPPVPAEVLVKLARVKTLMTPRVEKITDDIYLAGGFALENVQMVVTDQGLVIIDTTESRDAAREILARFREITDQPVRGILYTHGHLDHVSGTPAFLEQGTQIIATRDLVEFMQKDFGELRDFHLRSRLNQSGGLAPEYARPLPIRSLFRGLDSLNDPVQPTIPFDDTYSFARGGKTFVLVHTRGETPDHLMVWLPDEKALFCGDLYYASFPNLSTPMGISASRTASRGSPRSSNL
jgi:glyoxylase-like metal-dependent hydrolase (beta-lactamase superfamily II)